MKYRILIMFYILFIFTLASCCSTQMNASSASKQINRSVKVNIISTSDPKVVYGKLIISEVLEGLLVKGKFSGVPNPGKHGIHVHENGSCDDQGKAAGGHFNPDQHQHGLLSANGYSGAHAGDMGNVEIDQKGDADFTFILAQNSLSSGKYDISGKAIILHEKVDDFSQPTGNAGGRIGCGIIPKFQ